MTIDEKLLEIFKTHHLNNIGQGGLTSAHAREAITQLITTKQQELIKRFEDEVIGQMEERETADMSLTSWTQEDMKAFGRNSLRSQQIQALERIKEEL